MSPPTFVLQQCPDTSCFWQKGLPRKGGCFGLFCALATTFCLSWGRSGSCPPGTEVEDGDGGRKHEWHMDVLGETERGGTGK